MVLRTCRLNLSSRSWKLLGTAMVLCVACPARADLVISVSPASVTVAAGASGFFDVTLTNTGAAQNIAAFSFGLTTTSPSVTFTDATFGTAAPYLLAGDSFDATNGFDLATNTGLSLLASDVSESGLGTTLGTGDTLGLGHVAFTVDAAAAPGPIPVTFVPIQTSLADSLNDNVNVDTLNGGTIVIPQVVPEPATLLSGILSALVLLVAQRRARFATAAYGYPKLVRDS